MATHMVPSVPRAYDYNPQGSSTATVTTQSDNPFERSVSLTTRSMLPGLGASDADAAAPAAPSQPPAQWIQALQAGLTNIGLTALSQEVIKTPGSTPLPAAGSSTLPGAGSTPLSAPGSRPVPPANTVGPYPIRNSMVPQSGGLMSKLPWIIGGVAILGVGGILVFKKKN